MQTEITIKGNTYIAKPTVRAMFLWEQIKNGETFNPTSTLDVYLYFYCILLACNPNSFDMGWDEFIDVVDEDPDIIKVLNKLEQKKKEQDEMLEVEVKEPKTGKKVKKK